MAEDDDGPAPARRADGPRDRLARLDGGLRVAAALVGTLPPAVLGTAAIVAQLPFSRGVCYATGVVAVLPVWVLAMCAGFLARRGWLAWLVCLALTLASALAAPDAAFWPRLPD